MRRAIRVVGLVSLVGLIAATSLRASAPVREYTKSINKRFEVASAGELLLDNRHGDIDLTFWDEDEVRISVTIVVEASSEQRAQSVFDRIDVSFSAARDRVEARTVLPELSGRWGGAGNGMELKVNYAVRAPAGFAPELINRYGATRVGDIRTDARFEIAYGSLLAGDVAGRTELKLSYGQATCGELHAVSAEINYSALAVQRATDVKLEARYSQLDLRRSATLELTSRYGEYELGSVNTLTNDGRYDAFAIDSARSLSVESRYTNLSLNFLADAARMRLHYGSAQFGEVGKDFTRIDLAGDYTDFDIRLGESVPFRLEGEGDYVDFELPSYLTRVRREVAGTGSKFAGRHGEGDGAVVVEADHGSVRIR